MCKSYLVGSGWPNFRPLAASFHSVVFQKLRELEQIFGLVFPDVPVMCLFDKEMGWATFWATFSQIHLATLMASKEKKRRKNRIPRF
jgi:hypothetical protein